MVMKSTILTNHGVRLTMGVAQHTESIVVKKSYGGEAVERITTQDFVLLNPDKHHKLESIYMQRVTGPRETTLQLAFTAHTAWGLKTIQENIPEPQHNALFFLEDAYTDFIDPKCEEAKTARGLFMGQLAATERTVVGLGYMLQFLRHDIPKDSMVSNDKKIRHALAETVLDFIDQRTLWAQPEFMRRSYTHIAPMPQKAASEMLADEAGKQISTLTTLAIADVVNRPDVNIDTKGKKSINTALQHEMLGDAQREIAGCTSLSATTKTILCQILEARDLGLRALWQKKRTTTEDMVANDRLLDTINRFSELVEDVQNNKQVIPHVRESVANLINAMWQVAIDPTINLLQVATAPVQRRNR